MTTLRLSQFKGRVPRVSRRLLSEANGQVASNCLMTSGVLLPLPGLKEVAAYTGGTGLKSMYRMYDFLGNDYWLMWAGADVNAVKGPVAGDTTFRTYFSSDIFEPRVTDLALATSGAPPYPTQWYVLGVTPPVSAPTVSVAGGSGVQETRAYRYTFVTEWGEESEASPANATVTGYLNGTWNVAAMDTAPPNSGTITAAALAAGIATLTLDTVFGLRAGERLALTGALAGSYRILSVDAATKQITVAGAALDGTTGTWTREAPHHTSAMTKRVYRTQATSSGTAYNFVAEVPVAQTSYADTEIRLGESLATDDWRMPPADLQGLTVLPSGALAGFSGNVLCFSEPDAAYAWPLKYQLVTDWPVVGIGAFGQSVLVATAGWPYIASGVTPASMTMDRLPQPWPCLSKRSVASMGYGVMYATTYGLALVGINGPELATEPFYSVFEWRELPLKTLIGGLYDNRYYGAYRRNAAEGGMLMFGQGDLTFSDVLIEGAYSDPANGNLYLAVENKVYQWAGDNGTRLPLDWMSKEFVLPNPESMGVIQVDADFGQDAATSAAALAAYDAAVAANQALIDSASAGGSLGGASLGARVLNGSKLKDPPPLVFDSLLVTFYQGDDAVLSKQLLASGSFRLPARNKHDTFAIRVSGNVPVQSLVIGNTPLSLKAS